MRTLIVFASVLASYATVHNQAHGQGVSMSFRFGVGSPYPYYPYGAYGRPSYGLTFDRYGRPGYWDGNAIYRRYRPLYSPYPPPSWYGDSNWYRWQAYADRSRGFFRETPEAYSEERPLGQTPSIPSSEELSDASWQQLRRILRYGATQLSDDLRRQDAGRRWITYLQLGALYDQVAADDNVPPTQEEADAMQPILDKIAATADNDQFQNISSRWGFRALAPTLAEYLAPVEQRERRQLAVQTRRLEQELDELSNGVRWREYLTIPAAVFDPSAEDLAAIDQATVESAKKTLGRFDAISQDPQYRLISQLPSFKAMHETLASWIVSHDAVAARIDEQNQESQESEELPPPN